MSSHWSLTLDAILPPPGIDLGILQDPAALEQAARRSMHGARARLSAPKAELDDVLEVLFGEVKS